MTTDGAATEIEFLLLPDGASNEQYETNLAFFKQHDPALSEKISRHRCKKFKVCFNPDQSINILESQTKKVLYPIQQDDCARHFEDLFANMQLTIRPFTAYMEDTELSKELSAALPMNAKLHNELLEMGHLLNLLKGDNKSQSLNKSHINFLPLLRVYGVGLGQHITLACQRYDISCLIIHEPEFDLFYNSLYSTPWQQILTPFIHNSNRHYLICFGDTQSAIQQEQNLLDTQHPYYANAKAMLFGSLERDFKTLAEAARQYDLKTCFESVGGCYEDQAKGLKSAIQNIQAQSDVYNGKTICVKKPVFLIGSGPSLDDAMDYLKQQHENMFIVACGSAISALSKNGIQADIHVLQERFDDKQLLLKYANKAYYESIVCIKLNAVSTATDELYKQTLVLQKANDPGSTLLCATTYPHSYNVNPTVTNTGMVICSLLNPSKVYLLGLDYGSSESNTKKHSQHTLVLEDDHLDKNKLIAIPGNFKQTVYSNEFFMSSLNVTEQEIARTPNIQWINVGEGAQIKGTTLMASSQLPVFKKVVDKNAILDQINTLFDHQYDYKAAINRMQQVHIPASQEYLIALLELFDTVPQSRHAMMTTLSLITQAAHIGMTEDEYLPKKLFSLEFTSLLNNIYVQIATTQSNEQAISLYEQAVVLFKQHIELIFQDFLNIAASFK